MNDHKVVIFNLSLVEVKLLPSVLYKNSLIHMLPPELLELYWQSPAGLSERAPSRQAFMSALAVGVGYYQN